jgi:hypothetical protein
LGPEPRHSGEREQTRDNETPQHRVTGDGTALERGTRRESRVDSITTTRTRYGVSLLTCIHGTFDLDKEEPSTLIVFRVTLHSESHIAQLRIGLDFRSQSTANDPLVNDLEIVNYAPIGQSESFSVTALTGENPIDKLDKLYGIRVLLSNSSTTIIWDIWSSHNATFPPSHDFAVLLKRKSQENFVAKLSLDARFRSQSSSLQKYKREVEKALGISRGGIEFKFDPKFDTDRQPVEKLGNWAPWVLGKANLESLVSGQQESRVAAPELEAKL